MGELPNPLSQQQPFRFLHAYYTNMFNTIKSTVVQYEKVAKVYAFIPQQCLCKIILLQPNIQTPHSIWKTARTTPHVIICDWSFPFQLQFHILLILLYYYIAKVKLSPPAATTVDADIDSCEPKALQKLNQTHKTAAKSPPVQLKRLNSLTLFGAAALLSKALLSGIN